MAAETNGNAVQDPYHEVEGDKEGNDAGRKPSLGMRQKHMAHIHCGYFGGCATMMSAGLPHPVHGRTPAATPHVSSECFHVALGCPIPK